MDSIPESDLALSMMTHAPIKITARNPKSKSTSRLALQLHPIDIRDGEIRNELLSELRRGENPVQRRQSPTYPSNDRGGHLADEGSGFDGDLTQKMKEKEARKVVDSFGKSE